MELRNDRSAAVDTLDAELRERTVADPLAALTHIVSIRELLAEREREAVRAAIANHTWRELGNALGVSKQAAFQRFGKDWAVGLKTALPNREWRQEVARRLGG